MFLCKMNLIKDHGGKGSWPFSFERLDTSLPQADHVLVDLFSSMVDVRLCGQSPPTGDLARMVDQVTDREEIQFKDNGNETEVQKRKISILFFKGKGMKYNPASRWGSERKAMLVRGSDFRDFLEGSITA